VSNQVGGDVVRQPGRGTGNVSDHELFEPGVNGSLEDWVLHKEFLKLKIGCSKACNTVQYVWLCRENAP
jgi:hypothetical protein